MRCYTARLSYPANCPSKTPEGIGAERVVASREAPAKMCVALHTICQRPGITGEPTVARFWFACFVLYG